MEKERASRIRANNKLPAVNKQLAQKLLEDTNDAKKKKKADTTTSLLEDDRFKDMFADPEYQVDVESKEYELLHPGARQQRSIDAFVDNSSDEEDDIDDTAMASNDENMDSDDSDRGGDSDNDMISKLRKERQPAFEKPKPLTTIRSTERKFKSSDNKSFGSRLQSSKAKKQNEGHRVSRTSMGGMEMSFKPKSGGRGGKGGNRRSRS